jgi:hypothetical protein
MARERRPHLTHVVIDLRGSSRLFEAVRRQVRWRGRRWKRFTFGSGLPVQRRSLLHRAVDRVLALLGRKDKDDDR